MSEPPVPPVLGQLDDLEKQKDRFSAWRIGVLAGVTALLGALIGGVFSYLAAIHTVDSQAKQNQDQFLLQQRQVAYAKVTGEVKSDQRYFLDCSSGFLFLGKKDTVAFTEAVTSKTNALAGAVSTDAASVYFVGGDEAGTYAEKLDTDFQLLAADCQTKAVLGEPSKADTNPDLSKVYGNKDLNKTLVTEASDLAEFVLFGRLDIAGGS